MLVQVEEEFGHGSGVEADLDSLVVFASADFFSDDAFVLALK
ncbi:MAG: hypothetical protein OSB03_14880 [Vicinamibacterales bacterium]|nr:hypothetical protein [Vicinamibacterales bacterium]